jgi:hypothetical protein
MIFDAPTEESILATIARILRETHRTKERFLSHTAFQRMLMHKDAITMTKAAFAERLDELVTCGVLESANDSRNRKMYCLSVDSADRRPCLAAAAKLCQTIKEATSAGPRGVDALITRGCQKQTMAVAVTVLKAVGLVTVREERPTRLNWQPCQEQALKQLASSVAEKRALERRLVAIREEHSRNESPRSIRVP